MPDGTPHQPWYHPDNLPRLLQRHLQERREQQTTSLAAVTGFDHPDARVIRPRWAGERFDLHECVQALFRMRLPDQDHEAA
jgi:hypothetical protein